jgi:hypothetical protein
MKLKIVISLIVACLLFSLTQPVLAQKDTKNMGGQPIGDRGKASDMMKQGMDMRKNQGMQGLGFMHSAGNAFGEYVTFTIESETGNILDYGIAGSTLFDINIADFNYGSMSESGAVTRISNIDGSTLIQLHDNPTGVINILTSKSISLSFILADGVTATKQNDLVLIESDSVVGYLTGRGTISISVSESGSEINIDASPGSVIVFRTSPVNMPMFEHMHRRLSQEIARNRLGMEIALGSNMTYSAINYSPEMRVRIRAMEQDRIRMQINSTNPAGRLIGINLDNTSLMIGAHDRLRIYYDEIPLECVNDSNMVFNGTDRPMCWISPVQDRARAQLLIHVPDFSQHTIDIVVEPEEPTETESVTITPTATQTPGTPGFSLIVSLIGLLTLAYLRIRRN